MEHTTPSVNPNANSRVWVIMMRQCRFIDCNKGPTLVGDIDRRGACVCVRVGGGVGHIWESPSSLLIFSVNLKLF